MLYYDDGLFLRQPRIGIDVRRPVEAGFISHAHFDHMARHRLVYCTPATGVFFQHRVTRRNVRALQFFQPVTVGDCQLTTYPAGHVLGSAMLSIENDDRCVLYSGDFQLHDKPFAAEAAQPPAADTLIMECTFGRPDFVMPDRQHVIERLVQTIKSILVNGKTPVVHAYALGKAQTVTRILNDHGFKVYQHPEIYQISRLYEEEGCSLGPFYEYPGKPRPGAVLVLPPRNHHAASVGDLPRAERIGLTGWALRADCRQKLRVDHVLPLSDHADYRQLVELVERVQPKRVYCTHGAKSFVDDLAKRGFDARWLDRKHAYCLDV